jgi:hypothetical protein
MRRTMLLKIMGLDRSRRRRREADGQGGGDEGRRTRRR